MVGSFMISVMGAPSVMNTDNPMQLKDGHYMILPGILTPGRHIRPMEVRSLVLGGNLSMGRHLRAACGMLANTAYESVKIHNDKSPVFEFLRHVRNAASHGNKFNFSANEPARAAEWQGAKFAWNCKGSANALHGTECFGTFIGAADLIHLLWDVEQRIKA